MPTNQPRVLKAWQGLPCDECAQPTCYQARDPVTPWRAAAAPLADEDDDIERDVVIQQIQAKLRGPTS